MGMFDRIYVNCPKCNYETEVQSKNGGCDFKNYTIRDIEEIPNSVLEDITNREHSCKKCNGNFVIEVKYKVIKIPIKGTTKLL